MTRQITSLIAFLLLVAGAAFATDQVVTDCSTAAQLQQKILDVQSSGGGTITFTCGPGTKIDVTTQLPSITGNVTIDGGNNIELDGHYMTRILFVSGTLTLKNITIRRGSSNSSDVGFQDGGAIRSLGTLNISNAKFLDNHSTGGSAIYSRFGPLNIVDSEFAFNQGGGTAVKVGPSTGTAVITRCNFHQNSAFDINNSTNGGAIQIMDGPSVTVTNSIFSQNSASYGAAIYVTAQSSLYVGDSTFDRNGANGISGASGLGGGVYNRGRTTLIGCTFSRNLARGGNGGVFPPFGLPGGPGQGGAFYNMGLAVVSNCTFAGNQAAGGAAGNGTAGEGASGGDALGGAIYNADSVSIFNSTVSGNSAVGGAGGSGFFFNHGPPGIGEGGGIFEAETGGTDLQNDLIAGNVSSGIGPDLFGPFTSQGYNLIGKSDASTGLANGVNHDLVGSVVAPIDPKLGPLQNNGGKTETVALLSGSPAINAGSNAPPQDQRGYFRLGLPDIGAFEFGGFLPSRSDFNRDRFSDYLLFNPATGQTALWYLRGNALFAGVASKTLPAGWALVAAADFDQNGAPDYLLYHAGTRRTAVWFFDNTTFLGASYGPTLPAGWKLVAAADTNGDAKPDYLLYNPATRQTAIWFLNGTTFGGAAFGPTLPAGWTLVDAVDFNANSKPDYLLFNPGTRQSAIWYLNGTAFAGAAFGPTLPVGWTLEGASEFNANGKPDYVLFEPSTRRTAIWYLNGTTYAGAAFGPTLASGFVLASP